MLKEEASIGIVDNPSCRCHWSLHVSAGAPRSGVRSEVIRIRRIDVVSAYDPSTFQNAELSLKGLII